jgi:hypothetical protein
MDLTTPALLFPAISLLMLSYTNRFLALASLIRNLKERYELNRDSNLLGQIRNLKRRVILIRNMQALGILSLLICVLCMFLIFNGNDAGAQWLFAISLLLMIASLLLSIRETLISVNALNLELKKLEKMEI